MCYCESDTDVSVGSNVVISDVLCYESASGVVVKKRISEVGYAGNGLDDFVAVVVYVTNEGGLIAPPGGRGILNLRGGGGYMKPAGSGVMGVPIALSVSQ